jgi:hypothetical protein
MAITTTVPFYYSSQDAGAPQITANSPASMIAVLKACLVGSGGTAYGVKAPAGWSIPYEDDTNVAIVFKMAGGNQRYLRLGNPANTGTSGYADYSYLEVRGYNAMTDVNTGTNPFPTSAQMPTFRWAYAGDLAINTTTNIPWSIIASDRFFYIQLHIGNAGNNQGASWGCQFAGYFGDIVSYLATDTMQTILSGFWTGANYNQPGNPCWSANNQWYCYVPFKSSDNIANFDGFCYIYGSAAQIYGPYVAQPHWDTSIGSDWAGGQGLSNPSPSGQFFFQNATVFEQTSGSTIRGEMPGLLIPLHTRPFPDQCQITLGADNVVSWLAKPPLGNNSPSYNVLFNTSHWNTN